jgi:hypothetical protein
MIFSVKNNSDKRDENPAVFAKFKTRRLTNFSKSNVIKQLLANSSLMSGRW